RQQHRSRLSLLRSMWQFRHCSSESGQGVGEAVVAVYARHLFNNVDFTFYIQAPAWQRHAVLRALARGLESEACKDPQQQFWLDLNAQDPSQFTAAQLDGRPFLCTCYHINLFADELSATALQDELGHAVGGGNCALEIRAALKAVRGVRVQPMTPRGFAHADR